jgi:hypothetical protein
MTKVPLKCNHCGIVTEWYPSFLHEVGMVQINEKLYCFDCLKKLAHEAIDI